MPQMSPTWWMFLFLFNILMYMLTMMMIYFKWSPLYKKNKSYSMNKLKNFLFNDKNF